MQLTGKDLQQLLEKYHNSSASPEERRLLEQWYEQLQVEQVEAELHGAQETHIKEEIYAGIVTGINRDQAGATMPAVPVKKLFAGRWYRMSRVAAVLVLMTGLAWLAHTIWRKQPVVAKTSPVKREDGRQAQQEEEAKAFATLTVRTGRMDRKKTVLPDGSVAWLNAGSVLKYPAQFTGNSRHVYVEQGEMFFSVVKDAAHPFIVHTGSVTTTVLGTSFVVKQSFEKNTLEISVKTGKVKVEKSNSSGNAHALVARHLLPGDQLGFDTTANTYRLRQVPVKGIAAFTEGKLFYDDNRLEEIVYDIGRKYSITIDFDNEQLKQCRYRISFNDMPLNDCLGILSMLTNTRIEKAGVRRYRIKGASCN